MPRKRMTDIQKRLMIYIYFSSRRRGAVTAHEVGRDLGFANGKPIAPIMQQLAEAGHFKTYQQTVMNKPATYYFFTRSGRDYWENIKQENDMA